MKKQPAKAATMIADDDDNYYDSRVESGEKSVSFSSEDEILEIAARKKAKPIVARQQKASPTANVRDRLGKFVHKILKRIQ